MSNGSLNLITDPMCQMTRHKKWLISRACFPLLCHLNLSAAFKLNKTSMAPLQSMVISPLHETWKKRGSLLRVKPEAPFSMHTVIYHQKRFLPRKVNERLMGFPTGLLWPCRASRILEITVTGETLGDRRVPLIISSAFGSTAPRKRGFTAVSPQHSLSTGRHGQ